MRIIAAVIIVLWPLVVQAQSLSLLGMCQKTWNCNKTISMFRNVNRLQFGWLEHTFGEQCSCVSKLLRDKRPKVIRAHLINSPCMRNKRCGRYELLWRENAASASRKIVRNNARFFKKFDFILERFAKKIESAKGELKCYVSPCLECDLYENARRILLNRVSARLPNCLLVDNPYKRRCISGTICEQHGEAPIVSKPCIVDLDGTDGSSINLQNWLLKYRYCDLRFLWYPWMNCNDGNFVDPRQRKCV